MALEVELFLEVAQLVLVHLRELILVLRHLLLVGISQFLEIFLHLLLVLVMKPAVHFGNFHCFASSGLVQLLLQHLIFEVVLLFCSLELILKLEPLQSLGLKILLGIFELRYKCCIKESNRFFKFRTFF